MKNTKILEMLNAGKIDELKTLIQDEIYQDGLKSNSSAKKRYSAMKKYFTYTKGDNDNKAYQMPCVIDFEGDKYTSFVNRFTIVLTKESSGEMEQFDDPKKYLKVGKHFLNDGVKKEVDLKKVIAEAKSKGYKLKKSEISIEQLESYKYLFCYDDDFYKVGLLDAAYSIIDNGEVPTVWKIDNIKYSPLYIKNSIGYCMILPINVSNVNPKDDKSKVVIDVE